MNEYCFLPSSWLAFRSAIASSNIRAHVLGSGSSIASVIDAVRARELAELWLAKSEPRRWHHVHGVGSKAEGLPKALFSEDSRDRDVLIAAGYIHDIGYASGLKRTGLHQLDGARFIRKLGDQRLACLVAHHSESRFEVEIRGHREELSEYPREDTAVYDALVYCDLTTGPDGQQMAFENRINEVYERYGEGDVSRALRMAEPYLKAAVDRISQAINASGLSER
jgi:HD domain